MKLKGTYASGTSYSVGDVVKYGDRFYHLVKSASAGTAPTNTDYWQANDPGDTDLLDIMLGTMDSLTALNPSAKEIVLASSSSSSTKKFKVTVIDNGTISATEIT